jgi:pimeloyl-ACP methyl ester carboxylesterase
VPRLNRRQLLGAAGVGLLAGFRVSATFGAAASTGSASAVTVRRGYTDCRYGQLHYLSGRPAGGISAKPALVLLHQNPSSSVEFEYLVAEMARDREVVAFDTPGSGMSDWPPSPMDMTGYAQAFSDGIHNLALAAERPVDVFGFHTGTLLAAELAIAEPQRVGRVVLSGIPYRTEDERRERIEQIDAGPKLTEDGGEILEMQAMQWKFIVEKRDPRVPLRRAARLYMEKAKPMDQYWWPYRGVWTYPFAERFPLVAQPVLILQPEEALLEYSRRAGELLPDSRFVLLEGVERDVFDVAVDEFALELRRFLQ